MRTHTHTYITCKPKCSIRRNGKKSHANEISATEENHKSLPHFTVQKQTRCSLFSLLGRFCCRESLYFGVCVSVCIFSGHCWCWSACYCFCIWLSSSLIHTHTETRRKRLAKASCVKKHFHYLRLFFSLCVSSTTFSVCFGFFYSLLLRHQYCYYYHY